MIKIRESEYSNVIHMEVDGKVTEEDAEKSETFMNEHYEENASINALVDVKNLGGTDLGGLLKGTLIDIKHWKQYGKFAVITDSAWIEGGADAANAAPGIEVKQFDRAQMDQAWEWLKK
ncbi:STAS/SEC14 domain-containing protein [Salinicoccus sp. HZC-1]|uniref:STAS/SEC14 domain-containing protein n=1 Tax=Salinicoccus sp. HZC-1 TaxID=3385497 RepID=UPI00398B5302